MNKFTDPVAMLLAVHDIQQVVYKYAIAIDTREIDLLDECFAKDGKFHMADAGVFSCEEYKALCRKVLPALDATQHVVGPPMIEIEGDTAVSRSYFIAQHARNSLAPNPLLLIGGWYDDEFTRIDGQWRITKRIGTPAWYDGNPAVLGDSNTPGGLKWSAYRNCPLWLLGGGERGNKESWLFEYKSDRKPPS